MSGGRVSWIDHTKGLGIIFVVMLCSTLGYGQAAPAGGWMNAFAAWVAPMTLPAFFLIAGLFLHRSVFGSAAAYFDRKVLRLVYFYTVWLAIQTAFFHAGALLPSLSGLSQVYLAAWVTPASPLWFIQELVLFYIVTRLIRRLPSVRVFAAAALLQVVHTAGILQTGWSVTERFAEYYVYFYAGYAAVPTVFQYARAVTQRSGDVARVLAVWLAVHTAFVALGIADLPLVSLILGFAGILALVAAGVALASLPAAAPVGRLGRMSLQVYLGFFIPMQVLQAVLAATGIIPEPGTAALVVSAVSLAVSVVMYRTAKGTPLRVLYVRPRMFRLKTAKSAQRGSLIASATPESRLSET